MCRAKGTGRGDFNLMDKELLDSPPPPHRRARVLLYICGAILVILTALFFIPGEEVVENIDLKGIFAGYAIEESYSDIRITPIKSVTLETGGQSFSITCSLCPSTASARYVFGKFTARPGGTTWQNAGNKVATSAFGSQTLRQGNALVTSVFGSQALRRKNTLATAFSFEDRDAMASSREAAENALLLTIDEAIASHSPCVTYRQISLGELLFRNLRFRTELAWEDAQRQWNQLLWRLK